MAGRKRGRGSVRFRKDIKKFIIDYRDKRGERHIETIGEDKKGAEKALTQRQYELDMGKFNHEQRKKDFETYAKEWIETKTNVKESTIASYKGHLENHLKPFFGKMILNEIRREDIHGLIKEMTTGESSPKTIHNVLTTLHQILLDANVDGYINKSPYIRIKKPKRIKPDIDFLEIDEVKLLLDVFAKVKDMFYILVKLAVETGLRQSELLGLRWEDFDWNSGKVFVQRQYYRGKFSTPKSKKSTRRVALTKSLISELKAYRGFRNTGLVFCGKDGRPLGGSWIVKRRFKPALRTAGLRDIRFHDLRHTNVAIRIARGQDITYISRQLGHSTIQITIDTYGHMLRVFEDEQESKLEGDLYGNVTVTETPIKEKKALKKPLST